MDRGAMIDQIQNENARFIDNFHSKQRTCIKTLNPPGGKSHFSFGWNEVEPEKYQSNYNNQSYQNHCPVSDSQKCSEPVLTSNSAYGAGVPNIKIDNSENPKSNFITSNSAYGMGTLNSNFNQRNTPYKRDNYQEVINSNQKAFGFKYGQPYNNILNQGINQTPSNTNRNNQIINNLNDRFNQNTMGNNINTSYGNTNPNQNNYSGNISNVSNYYDNFVRNKTNIITNPYQSNYPINSRKEFDDPYEKYLNRMNKEKALNINSNLLYKNNIQNLPNYKMTPNYNNTESTKINNSFDKNYIPSQNRNGNMNNYVNNNSNNYYNGNMNKNEDMENYNTQCNQLMNNINNNNPNIMCENQTDFGEMNKNTDIQNQALNQIQQRIDNQMQIPPQNNQNSSKSNEYEIKNKNQSFNPITGNPIEVPSTNHIQNSEEQQKEPSFIDYFGRRRNTK